MESESRERGKLRALLLCWPLLHNRPQKPTQLNWWAWSWGTLDFLQKFKEKRALRMVHRREKLIMLVPSTFHFLGAAQPPVLPDLPPQLRL